MPREDLLQLESLICILIVIRGNNSVQNAAMSRLPHRNEDHSFFEPPVRLRKGLKNQGDFPCPT